MTTRHTLGGIGSGLTVAGYLRAIAQGNAQAAAAPPKPVNHDAVMQGEGLVVRFAPIKGETPTSALDRKIWLPAVLGPFTVAEAALHNEYDTLSAGQFSIGQQGGGSARRLRSGSTDTITMDMEAPWLTAIGQNPQSLRSQLYSIMRSHKAVQMLVTFWPNQGEPAEYDGSVTFRSLSKDVRPGERTDRYLTLAWSDWRDPKVSTRTHAPSSKVSRKKGVTLPATHALKSTDTLYSLSKEYYGTYDDWRVIRDANGISSRFGAKTPLVDLHGRFRVGAKVKIPKIPQVLKTSVQPTTRVAA